MQFNVYSDEQLSRLDNPLEPGQATFVVSTAEETISKNGNPMIKVVLDVWDKNGINGKIYDYFVSLDSMAYKIKSFYKSVGRIDIYESGNCDADDLIDLKGNCQIEFETYIMNNESKGRFKVKRYINSDPKKDNGKVKKDIEIIDDDIPF